LYGACWYPKPAPNPQCVTLVALLNTVKPESSASGGCAPAPSAQTGADTSIEAKASSNAYSPHTFFLTVDPWLNGKNGTDFKTV
jgi:hypothetical protein